MAYPTSPTRPPWRSPTPRGGSSQIIVSLRSGAIRANRTLRGLARRHRTLPRLVFTGRVVDVKNTRFSYRVRVRPNR